MKYPKAPITEAVMDIRVAHRQDLDVGEFSALGSGSEFSESADQFSVSGAIAIGAPATQIITPVKEGVQFTTKAKDKVFQAQRNGWAFNKFAPYDSWERLAPKVGRCGRGIGRSPARKRLRGSLFGMSIDLICRSHLRILRNIS